MIPQGSLFCEAARPPNKYGRGKTVNISTINVKNIETNEVYLKELLKTCDILAIHEHWLFLFQLGNIETTKFVSHYAYSKAVDDNDPPPPPNPKTQRLLRSLYVVP